MLELIDKFLSYLQYNKGRTDATVSKYRGYFSQLITWCQANEIDPLAITLDQLEEFTGKHAHEQGLKPSARKPLIAAVRGFYSWAQEYHHLASNPAHKLSYPQIGRKMPVQMQLQSAEKILMQCDLNTLQGVRDYAILATLIGCGVRRSGLVGLNESNLILVHEKQKEYLTIRVLEKGGKERYIPAPHEVRLAIKAYLVHPDLAGIDRTLPDGDRVLFVTFNNQTIPAHEYHGERRRMRPKAVNRILDRYGEQAGIPRDQRNPHAARHLFGTELAEEEVAPETRQAILGHADIKSTAIYTAMAMRRIRQAVDKANPMGKIQTPFSQILKRLNDGTD